LEHLVDRGHRERMHRVAEVLEDGRLRERAFGPQVRDLQRLLLGQTGRHELAKQPHHFFIAQRPVVALDDLAQHLSFALGAIELDRAREAFDDADLFRELRALGDQVLDPLVDGIDFAAQRGERVAAARDLRGRNRAFSRLCLALGLR
jgi:hypothetical protein